MLKTQIIRIYKTIIGTIATYGSKLKVSIKREDSKIKSNGNGLLAQILSTDQKRLVEKYIKSGRLMAVTLVQ